MIDVSLSGGVATLTLDRGAASNAFTRDHWDELARQVGGLSGDAVRAIVIRSAHETSFSAGADLAEMTAAGGEPGFAADLRTRMGRAIEAVAALSAPVVAAIDGNCFGAAVALALACDIRIVGDRARFATPPARLGIGYPAGDVARLSAQVGRGQAARMLFAGEAIDADEACRIGLAEGRATDAGAEAGRLCAVIAGNVPEAVRMLKATLADPLAPGNAAAFDALFAGRAFAERLAAFHERPR